MTLCGDATNEGTNVNKCCDFRSLENVTRAVLRIQPLHQALAGPGHHVDSRQQSASNSENLALAIVSGKAVFLQVSQIGKRTDFCKV